MLVYIGLFVYLMLLTSNCKTNIFDSFFLNNKKQKRYYAFAIATMIVFAAIRYNIGYDWENYYVIIKSDLYYLYYREPISEFIFFLGSKFNQPIISFLIFAVVIYAFVGKAILDNSIYPGKSLALYVALFYFDSLSIIRQTAAVAILFWGIKYIKIHDFKRYFFVCVLAACIHNSAILGVLVYFAFWMSRQQMTVVFPIVALFGNYLKEKILEVSSGFEIVSRNLRFINDNTSGRGYRLIFLVFTIYCFLMLYIRKGGINRFNKVQRGYINCCLIGMCMPYILGGRMGIRIATFFCIYLTLLWPEGDLAIANKQRWATYIPLLMCFIGELFVLSTQGNQYIPYQTYFG